METGRLKIWHVFLFIIAVVIIAPVFGQYIKDEFAIFQRNVAKDEAPKIRQGNVETATETESEVRTQKAVTQEVTGSVVNYQVIEEENVSYAGCTRLAVRIVMEDSASSEDAEATVKSVAEKYTDWNEVTVWGWGFSERSEVGASMFTKGMHEAGSCR